MKRILLIFGVSVTMLLGISLLMLEWEPPVEPEATLAEDLEAGSDQTEPADGFEEGSLSISDRFLNYFNRTNPATGENYSEQEVGALQYLWERLPLNDFVQSLLNPEAREEQNRHLYALAERIETGTATEEEIQEYYELRERELDARLEVLNELADQEAADRQRVELERMRSSMYARRDDQLQAARARAER